MIKVGIIGGADYLTGELTRLLINHPDVNLTFICAPDLAGMAIGDVHQGMIGETSLRFSASPELDAIDVLFLALPRGASKRFLEENEVPAEVKIIDLSPDFRMQSPEAPHDFVYGLPEINRKPLVRGALHASNPGCFATAVSLALLPLAKAGKLQGPIHVAALEGATDAGADPSPIGHYPWRNENIAVYRPLRHSAADEIKTLLTTLQPDFDEEVLLMPMRGSFSRGALVALYLPCDMNLTELTALYNEAFDDHNFTFIVDRQPDLKDVVNTNKCLIHLDKAGNRLIITAAIDNLLKGGAGNAVHLMNLLFGLSERTGLTLKPSAY
ncbi:MAG: N-acetyl-gamma-glutamyl-phosphate reductase [Muribaculaceae bacterium]|nr:N-acetyl-gamma-glutamyl-phosphate reductase [Muribaculaceae bacterium]